jgi:hypothetical protein
MEAVISIARGDSVQTPANLDDGRRDLVIQRKVVRNFGRGPQEELNCRISRNIRCIIHQRGWYFERLELPDEFSSNSQGLPGCHQYPDLIGEA